MAVYRDRRLSFTTPTSTGNLRVKDLASFVAGLDEDTYVEVGVSTIPDDADSKHAGVSTVRFSVKE